MKEKKISQTSLASLIRENCSRSCNQKDVWRWLNIGKFLTKNCTPIGFPKYETMVDIAMCLNVDVGYLTGDIKAKTYECQDTCNYLGLTPEAIEALKSKTNPNQDRFHISDGLLPEEYQDMFNKLFVHEKFMRFIESFFRLDNVYIAPDRREMIWNKVRKKYGTKTFDQAFDLYTGPLDVEHGDDSMYPQKVLNAYKDIDGIVTEITSNLEYNKEYLFWVCRYQLLEALEDLISDMYPDIQKPPANI